MGFFDSAVKNLGRVGRDFVTVKLQRDLLTGTPQDPGSPEAPSPAPQPVTQKSASAATAAAIEAQRKKAKKAMGQTGTILTSGTGVQPDSGAIAKLANNPLAVQ